MGVNRGIFCLEGEWEGLLTDRTSVEPPLRMLENMKGCSKVVHRDVATRDEFDYYLSKWLQKRYADFGLAYLAFHGDRGEINLGRDVVTLDDIAETIEGRAVGRILYFGSCATLAVEDDVLEDFCRRTGARAVVGYTNYVDWLQSAAFDLILIPELLNSRYLKPIFPRLSKDYHYFVHTLGLRLATSSWSTPRRVAREALVAGREGKDS